MADAEPIIIHGTSKAITIRSGSAVTRIKPGKTERPFDHVVVVIDGKETETLSNDDMQQKNWEIRIQAVNTDTVKPATAKPKASRSKRAPRR